MSCNILKTLSWSLPPCFPLTRPPYKPAQWHQNIQKSELTNHRLDTRVCNGPQWTILHVDARRKRAA